MTGKKERVELLGHFAGHWIEWVIDPVRFKAAFSGPEDLASPDGSTDACVP